MSDLTGTTIYDSTGNANKGILLGDYSLVKSEKNVPTTKNSNLKVSKIGTDEGAF